MSSIIIRLLSELFRPAHYPHDGLNNVRYKTDAIEFRPLYTWISVTLPPYRHPS